MWRGPLGRRWAFELFSFKTQYEMTTATGTASMRGCCTTFEIESMRNYHRRRQGRQPGKPIALHLNWKLIGNYHRGWQGSRLEDIASYLNRNSIRNHNRDKQDSDEMILHHIWVGNQNETSTWAGKAARRGYCIIFEQGSNTKQPQEEAGQPRKDIASHLNKQ